MQENNKKVPRKSRMALSIALPPRTEKEFLPFTFIFLHLKKVIFGKRLKRELKLRMDL
jgi:hypothetical protein